MQNNSLYNLCTLNKKKYNYMLLLFKYKLIGVVFEIEIKLLYSFY